MLYDFYNNGYIDRVVFRLSSKEYKFITRNDICFYVNNYFCKHRHLCVDSSDLFLLNKDEIKELNRVARSRFSNVRIVNFGNCVDIAEFGTDKNKFNTIS